MSEAAGLEGRRRAAFSSPVSARSPLHLLQRGGQLEAILEPGVEPVSHPGLLRRGPGHPSQE